MSSIPVPDEQTYYSSRRQDDVDALAWPAFSQRALDLLRSAGEVLHPAVLRVRVEELRRLMEISGELSDVLLSALDARRRLLKRVGEGGLVLAGDDDRDLHRLQEFAERNQLPYRTVLRSDASAWSELAKTTALPEAGTVVVTGERRVMSAPTTRDLATALGIDLWCLSDDSRCDLLVVGAGPQGWRPPSMGLGSIKRVASAVGEGSVVISAVHSYLADTKTS